MMNATGILSEKRILELAGDAGLDVKALEKAAKNENLDTDLDLNSAVAEEIGAEGTPNFLVASLDGSYVNLITGFRPEELKNAIAEAKRGEKREPTGAEE